jgi:death-on-curing protein
VAGIRFLSIEDVLQIQQDTIAIEGGLAGLRDAGLLASAVMMPQQQFDGSYLHDGLAAMAAAYLFHLSQNHAFIDGNKRAAVMSALIFLDVNGVETLPAPEALEGITLAVAAGGIRKPELTGWMRAQTGDPSSP